MTESEQIYKNNFRHFSERLSLQYSILITFEYYVLLCGLKYVENGVIKKRTDGKGLCLCGYILIHQQKVYVIKSLHIIVKHLLTCIKPV